MPRVSVIVPVYGVEKYIERCCASIFEQTFQDFEVIFVVDGSKDRSEVLLESAIQRAPAGTFKVRLIKHQVNRGISATRETGLAAATGELLLYVDSDDYISPRMLEVMLAKLNETQAEIVYCDYFEVRNGSQSLISQAPTVATPAAVTAAMLHQSMAWTPWNKLFRRSLAVENGIHWPSGINVGEDMVFVFHLFSVARRVEYVAEALYFYNRDNLGSYLNSMSVASVRQSTNAVQLVSRLFESADAGSDISEGLVALKLSARYLMLFTLDESFAREAAEVFPETNSRIFSFRRAPIYWRLAAYFAAQRQWRRLSCAFAGIRFLRRVRSLG